MFDQTKIYVKITLWINFVLKIWPWSTDPPVIYSRPHNLAQNKPIIQSNI